MSCNSSVVDSRESNCTCPPLYTHDDAFFAHRNCVEIVDTESIVSLIQLGLYLALLQLSLVLAYTAWREKKPNDIPATQMPLRAAILAALLNNVAEKTAVYFTAQSHPASKFFFVLGFALQLTVEFLLMIIIRRSVGMTEATMSWKARDVAVIATGSALTVAFMVLVFVDFGAGTLLGSSEVILGTQASVLLLFTASILRETWTMVRTAKDSDARVKDSQRGGSSANDGIRPMKYLIYYNMSLRAACFLGAIAAVALGGASNGESYMYANFLYFVGTIVLFSTALWLAYQ